MQSIPLALQLVPVCVHSEAGQEKGREGEDLTTTQMADCWTWALLLLWESPCTDPRPFHSATKLKKCGGSEEDVSVLEELQGEWGFLY